MKILATVLMSAALIAPAVAAAQQSNPPPQALRPSSAPPSNPATACYYAGAPYTQGAALKMPGGVRVCGKSNPMAGPVFLEWKPAGAT